MMFRVSLFILPAALLVAPAIAVDDHARSIESWRAQRIERLKSPGSWLSLIGLHPLPPGEHTTGSAEGNAIRLSAGPARLGIIRHEPDGRVIITLDDETDGTIDGATDRSAELVYAGGPPTFARSGTVSVQAIKRGGGLYLRVRDSASPRRLNFPGIDYFDTDPAWRIEADWVPFDPVREIPILNVMGYTDNLPSPGKAVFTVAGHRIELHAVLEGPGEPLFFVFADETTGIETYGGGRTLYADDPKDGKVVIDFNRAYNPPCAYSAFTTCSVPPRSNRMPVRVTAGEKEPRPAPR